MDHRVCSLDGCNCAVVDIVVVVVDNTVQCFLKDRSLNLYGVNDDTYWGQYRVQDDDDDDDDVTDDIAFVLDKHCLVYHHTDVAHGSFDNYHLWMVVGYCHDEIMTEHHGSAQQQDVLLHLMDCFYCD